MIFSHGFHFECIPNFLSVLVVLFRDVLIVEHGVEGFFRRKSSFFEFLQRDYMIVRKHAFSQQKLELRVSRVNIRQFSKLIQIVYEFVQSSSHNLEVVDESEITLDFGRFSFSSSLLVKVSTTTFFVKEIYFSSLFGMQSMFPAVFPRFLMNK